MRFPLRRQQANELAVAAPAEAAALSEPIPFPVQGVTAPDPGVGTWDEPARPRTRAGELRLRSQMTSSDARAERLVRQVRNEVVALQESLTALAKDQHEMIEVDPAAVVLNPEAALTLSPAILVRAVVAAESENRQLRKRTAKARVREQKLRERMQELQLSEAARVSRMQTLEDVVSVLHGNLTDVRQEREFLRQWAQPRIERPGELPSGESQR